LGHFGKPITNTWEVLQCGAGEGWRKSVGQIMRNEVLHRVKKGGEECPTYSRRKANWISHILRRNCLLKHIIEGKIRGRIEVTGTRGRRCTQLLDDLTEKTRHLKLKEKVLDRTLRRTRFGRGY
jgi:hypothetical protein